jgi:hypothetical protein
MRLVSRYEHSDRNRVLMDQRTIIAQILMAVHAIRNEVLCNDYLALFKRWVLSHCAGGDGEPVRLSPKSEEEFLSLQFRWVQQVMQSRALDFSRYNNNQNELEAIVMDLLMYDSRDLVNVGFQLLEESFAQRARLARCLQEVQLIDTAEKTRTLLQMQRVKKVVALHVDMTEIWLDPTLKQWSQDIQQQLLKDSQLKNRPSIISYLPELDMDK